MKRTTQQDTVCLQTLISKSQIPLRYPASEPARELVCDLLASC